MKARYWALAASLALLGWPAAADEAKKLAALCLERGLILLVCGSYGNVIRVLVPFVITDEQLEQGLSILEQGLEETSS